MGPKDQIIVNLKREIELFKMENRWLKVQLNQISGGEFEIESSAMRSSVNLPALHESDMNMNQEVNFDNRPGSKKAYTGPGGNNGNNGMHSQMSIQSNQTLNPIGNNVNGGSFATTPQHGLNDKILKEFNFEIGRLRNDNNQFRTKNMYLNKTMMELIEENIKLVNRIENLENVFIKHERRSEQVIQADIDVENFN